MCGCGSRWWAVGAVASASGEGWRSLESSSLAIRKETWACKCGSGGTVVLTGTTWDLPPAPGSNRPQQKLVLLPSCGSKLDPGLREGSQRFPASLQVTPAPDGGPAGLLLCHELPRSDLQRWCHTELGSRRTELSQIVLGLIPEMHRERNSGKGSSSLESLAPSKALLGRNPVVLFVTAESKSPKPKICLPGTAGA